MNQVTFFLGIGLGLLVVIGRSNPKLLHLSTDSAGQATEETKVMLIIGACASLLASWSLDMPDVFRFLAKIPWSIVPLCFFVWYAFKRGARHMMRWALTSIAITSVWKIASATHDVCFGLYRQECPLPKSMQPDYTENQIHALLRQRGIIAYEPATDEIRDTSVTLNESDTLLIVNSRRSGLGIWWRTDLSSIVTTNENHGSFNKTLFRLTPGYKRTKLDLHVSPDNEGLKWLASFKKLADSTADLVTKGPKQKTERLSVKPKAESYASRYPPNALSPVEEVPAIHILSPKSPVGLRTGKGCGIYSSIEIIADQPAYWGATNTAKVILSSELSRTRKVLATDGMEGSVEVTASYPGRSSASVTLVLDNTPCSN